MRRLRGSLIAGAVDTGLKCAETEVKAAACVAAVVGGMSSDVEAKLQGIVQGADNPMSLRATACEALASQELTETLRRMLSEFVLERGLAPTLRRYAIDGLARFDDPIAVRTMEEVVRRTVTPSMPTRSSQWPR